MASNLHVCLFPQEICWGNKAANLKTIEEILDRVHHDTDIIILPEMFSTGFMSDDKEAVRQLAEWNSGETVEFLKSLSKEKNIAIAGSYIADTGGSLFNRAFFIEPNGDEAFADKRHLFTMAGEHKVFSSGDERLLIRFRGWNIAMVVCYDIRFPVWCRNVGNEYDLLIAVANWPKVRINAWTDLLRARAIENEAYVCGVNCKGTDFKGFDYDGASFTFDFKGKDISMKNEHSPLIYASLSMDKLEIFRQKFPAWKDADSFVIKDKE